MDEVTNGAQGILQKPVEAEALDRQKAYINVDKDGWLVATIHISRGLYPILGFLAEIEDNARVIIGQMIKQKQEAEQSKLVRPGFRGFNPFKRK